MAAFSFSLLQNQNAAFLFHHLCYHQKIGKFLLRSIFWLWHTICLCQLRADLREKAYQYNLPIRIRRNCWLVAGVIVVPGVTIGDDTMIGAGSVVTKDIPANVVAVGNPCHVLRPISEHDKEYFYRDRKINWETL